MVRCDVIRYDIAWCDMALYDVIRYIMLYIGVVQYDVADPLHNSIRTVHYNREFGRDADMGGRGGDRGGRHGGRFDSEPSRSGRGGGGGSGNWSFSDGRPAFPERSMQPFNRGGSSSSSPSLSLKLGPNEAIRPSLELTTQMVDHVRRALSHSNIGEQAMRDITTSIGTLASYGLIGPEDRDRRGGDRNWSY